MASTAREHPPPSLRYFCWFSFLNICFFEMTLIDVRPKSGDVLWVELTFISVCRTVLGSDPYWRLARRNEARAYKTICILTQLTQNKYVASSSAGINKQSPLCSARLCHAARAWLPSSRNSISILPHGSSQATLGLRTVLKADVRSGVRSWGLRGENFSRHRYTWRESRFWVPCSSVRLNGLGVAGRFCTVGKQRIGVTVYRKIPSRWPAKSSPLMSKFPRNENWQPHEKFVMTWGGNISRG